MSQLHYGYKKKSKTVHTLHIVAQFWFSPIEDHGWS